MMDLGESSFFSSTTLIACYLFVVTTCFISLYIWLIGWDRTQPSFHCSTLFCLCYSCFLLWYQSRGSWGSNKLNIQEETVVRRSCWDQRQMAIWTTLRFIEASLQLSNFWFEDRTARRKKKKDYNKSMNSISRIE